MLYQTKKAFTMLELTFVIVIIGILSAIAIPKFSATRDDAVITKARVTVASLRNAISTERQLRVLRGDFTPITNLDGGTGSNSGGLIFDRFDLNSTGIRVLEYPMRACANGVTEGCWLRTNPSRYTYYFPHNANTVVFDSNGSRFDCVAGTAVADCNLLTQ
jgi:general secretion pathway protein G